MGRAIRAAVALTVVLSGSTGFAVRAEAAKPAAVVSMGDSYISGEAGRWAGNSASGLAVNAFNGTDRGRAVYGTTDADPNTCHRSDVAEIAGAGIAGAKAINLACSGAVTTNLLTTAEGGEGQGGETPQGDQLKTVAAQNDVKAIVVSVGGNDLGFADIVLACFTATPANPCRNSQQPALTAGVPAAQKKVEGVVTSIRRVMAGAGYKAPDYRLILQSYPSVAPRAEENRFPADGDPRRSSAGCQFTNVDSDWSRDEASAQIDRMVGDAAAAQNAEYLDLHDLFQGHEVCSRDARQATALDRPDAAHSEWGRPVGASFIAQGNPNGTQESFHPNAFGQQAFGACFAAAYAAQAGRFTCASAAGRAPKDVSFKRTAAGTGGGGPAGGGGTTGGEDDGAAAKRRRLTLRARRLHARRRGHRVCVRFVARSRGRRVRGVRVDYRGRHKRTGMRGRATICDRYAVGRRRHFARARKAGYRKARRTFAFRVRSRRSA